MSLLVSVFSYDANNKMQFVEQDRSDELAGFESCRRNLYGNSISRDLGLKLLSTLVESDLCVRFEDLQNLKREVDLMLDNLDLYAKAAIYQPEYIKARLNNILKAIAEAEKIKGQVVIR